MTIFNTTTNSAMVFRIVNTQPKAIPDTKSGITESTVRRIFTSDVTSREPLVETIETTPTPSTIIASTTTAFPLPTPKFNTTAFTWTIKPILANPIPTEIRHILTSTHNPIDIILPVKKWDNELTNSQTPESKFTHSRYIEPKYTESTRNIDTQLGPTTENINVIKTFESNTFFMTVCVVFAAILLLTMIIFVFIIFKKNFLMSKKNFVNSELRNGNNGNANRNSNIDGKNGDHSAVVYAKAKSIFHTPLPGNLNFDNTQD